LPHYFWFANILTAIKIDVLVVKKVIINIRASEIRKRKTETRYQNIRNPDLIV